MGGYIIDDVAIDLQSLFWIFLICFIEGLFNPFPFPKPSQYLIVISFFFFSTVHQLYHLLYLNIVQENP